MVSLNASTQKQMIMGFVIVLYSYREVRRYIQLIGQTALLKHPSDAIMKSG
jgi:hypothetical protein